MDRELNKRSQQKNRKVNLIKPSRAENYASMIKELEEYFHSVDFFDSGLDWKAVMNIVKIHEKNDSELI